MMNEKIRLLNKMIKYLDKEYKNVADKDAAKRNKKNGVDVRAYKFKTMNNQGKHREPTGADELRYKMVLDSYSSIASTLIYDMMTDMSISSQKAETHRDEILKTAARFDVPVERYEKKLEKKKNAELKAEQEKELGKNKPEVKAGEKNEEMIKNNKKKAVKTNAIF